MSYEEIAQTLEIAPGPDAHALLKSLAKNLVVLTSQRLLQRTDQPSRVPLYQWLGVSPEVSDALIGGNLAHLQTLQSHFPQSRSEDQAWDYLIESGYVTSESRTA